MTDPAGPGDSSAAEQTWDTPPGHFGSDTNEWATPVELLRPLDAAVDGFDLDPCSGAEARSIADEQYTECDDGLSKAWFGSIWVNPPYSDMEDWMRKALDESHRDDVETILVLAPARTSTQWFHRYATQATVLAFIEGRLTFGNPDDQVRNAPFPSLIAVFGTANDDLLETLERQGVVYSHDRRFQTTRQVVLDG